MFYQNISCPKNVIPKSIPKKVLKIYCNRVSIAASASRNNAILVPNGIPLFFFLREAENSILWGADSCNQNLQP